MPAAHGYRMANPVCSGIMIKITTCLLISRHKAERAVAAENNEQDEKQI